MCAAGYNPWAIKRSARSRSGESPQHRSLSFWPVDTRRKRKEKTKNRFENLRTKEKAVQLSSNSRVRLFSTDVMTRGECAASTFRSLVTWRLTQGPQWTVWWSVLRAKTYEFRPNLDLQRTMSHFQVVSNKFSAMYFIGRPLPAFKGSHSLRSTARSIVSKTVNETPVMIERKAVRRPQNVPGTRTWRINFRCKSGAQWFTRASV